jgi:hypothetical protein
MDENKISQMALKKERLKLAILVIDAKLKTTSSTTEIKTKEGTMAT